jgi:hypothetical protein
MITGTTSNGTLIVGGTSSIGTSISSFTTTPGNTHTFNSNNNTIMQNKVAVFKITRDKDEKIVKTEFLKAMWVETKNGQSVEFQVARDKDLVKYEASELYIRVIYTLTF